MSKKTFYITTPIYYASGNLHIGHTYTTVVCDAIAKYKKMKGYDVYYLTGTDEHGQKIQEKAKEKGVTPQKFVDDLVEGIKDLWSKLKIDYDKFIRTTDEYHVKNVQKIFTKMLENGDIYKGSYEGWYCTPCESFWTESQLGEGHVCPDCGRPVHLEKEEAYFFRMSKYADKLLKYYMDNPGFIEPEARQNEMINNFIKPGLNDLCVSRTSFDWGVKVNEDPKHVVYVWLDALFNYLSALGYNSEDDSLFNKYWKNDEDHEVLHVVGKEIIRFHVIYWPIFLMSLGIELPTKVYGHGWIVMKGGKMSKSKGNVFYPDTIINRYGLDALRYFVSTCIPFGSDGLFTPDLFIDNFNNDLVNNYGNLLNRTVSMVSKYFDGTIPEYQGIVTEFDQKLEDDIKTHFENYEKYFNKFEVDDALKEAFAMLSKANKYIDDTKPWALAKDETKRNELASVMTHLALVIKAASILLSPMLVETPAKAFAQLGVEDTSYENLLDFSTVSNKKVTKGEVLFPRLDAKVELEYFESQMPDA